MEKSFEQPQESARCPACGNPLDSRATMCAACGTALVAADATRPAPDSPRAPVETPPITPVAAPEPALASGAEPLADEPEQRLAPVVPVPFAASRRCEWCGATNPPEAERCLTCHAMFPRPEQDEAMRRAGEARIQAVEDEIALRQRARKWYGFGKRSSS